MNGLLNRGGEDLLQLIEDENAADLAGHEPAPWRILIVDDDQQVHTTTEFALADVRILGRALEFLHAYNSRDAQQILSRESGIAVVFLDVVMETEDAGLKLVRVIREELGLDELRIILRTGQPGYAPELQAIRDFDINDYRTKSELTRTRLVTSLTSAIRSYEQIQTIAYSRRGLEKIVYASSRLFDIRALEGLAEGVLTQIASLLGFPPNGVVCAQRGAPLDGSNPDNLYVIGAIGLLADAINQPLEALENPRIEGAIRDCIRLRENIYQADYTVLYLKSGTNEEAVFLDSGAAMAPLDRQLLEVFAANISVGFSNVYLFQRLNFLAYFDPLTGLPNRRRLVGLVDEARHQGRPYVVVLADIDHFADINDVMGMPLGDSVLRAVADRLRGAMPESVQMGRYGGDVLCLIGDPSCLSAAKIHGLFIEPFEVSEYKLPISVTLGICDGDAGQNGLETFKHAGLALTRAKRTARGRYVSFSEQMTIESRQRLEMMQALRRAINENQLELHYQPQVDLRTGKVAGAEALLRWRREDGKQVSPAVFIPLAECSGLITQIGEWVMFEACRQACQWQKEGLGHLKLAINVSAQQVRLGDCANVLRRAMVARGLNASQLEIEITESLLLEDIESATASLDSLKEIGVSIALDDFGTGFSSLSYLHRLPIDSLKVDRAFINEIGCEGDGERIAEMIVALGKLLELSTVAEGVETVEQAEAARQWGCDTAQGFLYTPALQPADFALWVKAWDARED